MQLFQALCPATQLALLFFPIALSTICTAVQHPKEVHTAPSPKLIPGEEKSILPPVQSFSTQLIINNRSSAIMTMSASPPYTFRLLDFQAISISPATEFKLIRALERTCEAIAYWLLDLDLIEEQNLVMHFGDFTLDFYDMVEHLNMLAVKAVLLKLTQMIAKGFGGTFRGEIANVQAGVRTMFAFGVLGGQLGDWELRKRKTGDYGAVRSSDSYRLDSQ